MRRAMGSAVWLLALVGLATTSAHGDYRDLRQTFEQYQPPSYLFRPHPAARLETQAEDAFAIEKQRLLALKTRWEKALQDLFAPAAFYHPDPQVLADLETARTSASAAQAAMQQRFSQDVVEVLALLRSPGIKAAENRLRAALEKFSQVTAVDDILRQYTAFTEGVMTGVGAMRGKDEVRTQFPFPGVLALKGQVVTQDVLSALERLEAARRDAVTAARKSHWRLWFVRQEHLITERTVALLRELELVSTTRYEAGRTSFQDVIKVRVQRELLEEQLITLREQQGNAHMELREILHLPPDTRIGMAHVRHAEANLPALTSLYTLALASRQELRQLRARIGKMERMIEMAETMLLPAFDMGLSRYRDEAIKQVGSQSRQSTFATRTQASMGAGLPKMPWFGSRDAYLREIRQKRQALQEELNKMQDATITRVRKKWFALDQARREKRLYQDTVVQLSQSALDVSTRGYESDNVPFADVIASYTLWLDTHLALAQRRSAYGIGLAELEQVVGQSFTQHRKE
ncbi:MAG: TolC family protein [Candidatus Tectomicrobia bacterium]|nr:TolC family protein [Candidatus Tectomicrobia bacterium]